MWIAPLGVLELRIHCFNLDSELLTVHDGKGQKDRTVPLPARMMPEIREQIEAVRRVHKEDLAVRYSACSCRGNWIRSTATQHASLSGSGFLPQQR